MINPSEEAQRHVERLLKADDELLAAIARLLELVEEEGDSTEVDRRC